jgi:hypothetical protein
VTKTRHQESAHRFRCEGSPVGTYIEGESCQTCGADYAGLGNPKEVAAQPTPQLRPIQAVLACAIVDVPYSLRACFLLALPGAKERRNEFSPSSVAVTLTLSKRQEQAAGLFWAQRLLKVHQQVFDLVVGDRSAGETVALSRGAAHKLCCFDDKCDGAGCVSDSVS